MKMTSQKIILIVEDNEINRIMLRGILEPQYKVLEAQNGLEALKVLGDQKDNVSLILLDIMMPVMDGYTFLSILKNDPSIASIPVIVATQNDNESDEVAALSHGATDFVAKPYRPQIILHRVASIINLRENAAMINQFRYDRLTGLYSKEFFYRRVREELQAHPDQEYDMLCSNIENFKLINDILGVPAGDQLLISVAEMIQEKIGDRGICGRLSADQFACLLRRPQAYPQESFINANSEINTLANMQNVVVKWGVYVIRDKQVSVEQMCDRALLAVRRIKGQYNHYVAAYDDTLRNKLLREQAITDSMEAALKERQFVIYLQPKFQIKDDQLAGAEALVRWNHPQWGFQSPAEFIPLFERNGFITKLDQYVWEQTCAKLHQWDQAGYPPISVSVNVSRADIYNSDLIDFLTRILKKYELQPSRLHLEITESAYTENPGQIIATVEQLRTLGFVIEMDDFGSGYSSLNMLNQLSLDILKLDMKFIQNETAKPTNQGILRFIMSLARWMNLSVVAEGVETREQLERLRETGCDYVQGYYFARPMPCEEFEKLLQKQCEQKANQALDNVQPLPDQQKPMLLLADGDVRYCEEMRSVLSQQYQVQCVGDGQSVYQCLDLYASQIRLIVLSMDIKNPDGVEVLKTLQHRIEVRDIPIIASGYWDDRWEEAAFNIGADDFAGKPHTPMSLWKRVQRTQRLSVLRRQEQILREEAYRDYLTDLLNRRGLYAVCQSLRQDDAPLALFLFDLDNLKKVNDQLGHDCGDQRIRQFSRLLRSHFRQSDIFARLGQDEFIVVMKKTARKEAVVRKGEALGQAFVEAGWNQDVPLTVSAGIAMWDLSETLDEVLSRADSALKCAKVGCQSRCRLWEEANVWGIRSEIVKK